jgi:hypothetical protein
MKYLIACAFIIWTNCAYAQTFDASKPNYVPISLDEKTYIQIMNYLGDVPSKYANPLIQLLNQKANEAIKTQQKEKEGK